MRRRIILILIIVVTLGVLGGGIWYLASRPPRLLERAKLALAAGNPAKAREYAQKHVQDHPRDWQGYYYQAEAMARMGEPVEANAVLTRVLRHEQDWGLKGREVVALAVMRSEVQILPARQTLALPNADANAVRAARQQLIRAADLLDRAVVGRIDGRAQPPLDAPDASRLDIQACLGVNVSLQASCLFRQARKQLARRVVPIVRESQDLFDATRKARTPDEPDALIRLGLAARALADAADPFRNEFAPADANRLAARIGQLQAQARQAVPLVQEAAAKDLARRVEALAGQADRQLTPSLDEMGRARDTDLRAIEGLSAVYAADPARHRVAQRLVELVLRHEQRDQIDALRQQMVRQSDPPPGPLVQLMVYRLHELEQLTDPQARRRGLQEQAKVLDSLLAKHPEHVDALLARGELAAALGDFGRAEELFEKLQNSAVAQQAQFDLARAYQQQGKLAKARGLLDSLLTQATMKRNPEVHYLLGLVLDQMADQQNEALDPNASGRHPLSYRAHEEMREAVRYNPRHAGAHYYLVGSLLDTMDKPESAYSESEDYLRAHPEDPRALDLYVRSALQTRRADQARLVVADAQSRAGRDPVLLVAVAECWRLLGRPSARDEALRSAADCKPRDNAELAAVAQARRLVGRQAEAEARLARALAESPNDPALHHEMGRLLMGTRRVMEAIDHFRRAALLAPRNVLFQLSLAQALFGIEEFQQCREVLQNVPDGQAEKKALLAEMDRRQNVGAEGFQTAETYPAGRVRALYYLLSEQYDRALREVNKLLVTSHEAPDYAIAAEAHARLGQRDQAVNNWVDALKLEPEQPRRYQDLAAYLARELSVADVARELGKIAEARKDTIDMTLGWLLRQQGDLRGAANVYARIAANVSADAFLRRTAQWNLAGVLADLGQPEAALAIYAELAASPDWRRRVTWSRVELLIRTRRFDMVRQMLQDLRALGVKDQDAILLQNVVAAYSVIKDYRTALEVCDQMQRVLPSDDRARQLRATVLANLGRVPEGAKELEALIQADPNNPNHYIGLAGYHDRVQQPAHALAALDRMAGIGPHGRADSLYRRGFLLASWGLFAQAIDAFSQVGDLTDANAPIQQTMALARALIGLGRNDRARQMLQRVPKFSRSYPAAQLMRADIAESSEDRDRVLADLQAVHPHSGLVLAARMQAMINDDRPQRAWETFDAFYTHDANVPPAQRPAEVALDALLQAGDLKRAYHLCQRMRLVTGIPFWRNRAALLGIDVSPDAVARLLPEVSKASHWEEAILGIAAASRRKDADQRSAWANWLLKRTQDTGAGRPAVPIPDQFQILAALADGQVARAREIWRQLQGDRKITDGFDTRAINEVLAAADSGEAAYAEAARLLQILLALRYRMPQPARTWSIELLQKRPQSQYAGTTLLMGQPDLEQAQQGAELLQPPDSLIALEMRRMAALTRQDYDEALRYAEAEAKACPKSRDFQFTYAKALQAVNRLEEAHALFARIWQDYSYPEAGNNVAYLASRLYGDDPDRLKEALQWAYAAYKAQPDPAILETAGWIEHQLGNDPKALAALRTTIPHLARNIEAHYHLGVVELAAGDKDLGRWHLETAVMLADNAREQGVKILPDNQEAADKARQELDKLPAAKTP